VLRQTLPENNPQSENPRVRVRISIMTRVSGGDVSREGVGAEGGSC